MHSHIAHLHACHIHAWLKCLKRFIAHVSYLAFSLLMIHLSLLFLHGHFETNPDYDLTDSDIHMFMPYFPVLKAQDTRNSAPASRSWATWPSKMQTHPCDTMGIPDHITITKGSNGPSTRVLRVMLITSPESHVSSRVCASFAVLGIVGQSLLSTLLQLDVRIQGLLLGCAVISLSWCERIQSLLFGCAVVSFLWCKTQFSPHSRGFASLSTILSSWCVVSESANPWCAQHGG